MQLLSHYIEHQSKNDVRIVNWHNHIVTDSLSYSYRDTVYDNRTYPSALHYHDYYELVVLEEGDIRYICEGHVYHPHYGDCILIPPGKFHMSVIHGERTRYRRHVFYFYPSAFDTVGHGVLTSFVQRIREGDILTFASAESEQKLMEALGCLKKTFTDSMSPLDRALGLSHVLQVFCFMNQTDCRAKSEGLLLPERIRQLQQYIDANFATISSVSEVAQHFFYSREYISRLFRQYFDTTISDYIMKRRIAESQALIMEGVPLIEVAYRVGFGSLSTFIRAFRCVTDMTPSEYRKWKKR